ncbi:MAG: FAD:protein FMN transferase [Verrucomicrobiae bacterium]|nr:FAD:protein FMN transferase [Verrucomicrobiae bacterium]
MNPSIRCRPFLGTFVEIGVTSDNEVTRRAVDDAFDAIGDVHRLLSFHDPESDLSRLNASNGEWVRLHPLSLRVLRLAKGLTEQSGGLFNCTVGAHIVELGVLPNHLRHRSHRAASGLADDLVLKQNAAHLASPILITLDGIAKGYAVDRAVAALLRGGVASGWVNAGGDMRAFGDIALPVHQRSLTGELLPLGGLSGAAIATSRVAPERDSRFPGCIVNTDGGQSCHGVWTVLARRAWRADALTKVAANAPNSKRESWIEQLGGRLIVPETGVEVAA